jgi:hypothetical protein
VLVAQRMTETPAAGMPPSPDKPVGSGRNKHAKRWTRERCDYTMPTLKLNFPVAPREAVPPQTMRNYMRECLEHAAVLQQIGRHGDFGEYGSLVKQYKSHRSADLIRLGCASDPVVRHRANWGSVAHARLITLPLLDDEESVGPSGAFALDHRVALAWSDRRRRP